MRRENDYTPSPGLESVTNPAPVHINPSIERLWSQRVDHRVAADLPALADVATRLIAELLDQSIPAWEIASFELVDCPEHKTGKTLRLHRVFNLAEKQVIWQEQMVNGERELLTTLGMDLLDCYGLPEDACALTLTRGFEPGTVQSELLEIRARLGNTADN